MYKVMNECVRIRRIAHERMPMLQVNQSMPRYPRLGDAGLEEMRWNLLWYRGGKRLID
jgi:hypothetical protein